MNGLVLSGAWVKPMLTVPVRVSPLAALRAPPEAGLTRRVEPELKVRRPFTVDSPERDAPDWTVVALARVDARLRVPAETVVAPV